MFGKGHQRRQDVCLLSETNSVNDERLDAGTIHAECSDTAEAWGLNSKQQCKDEKTGRYIQFISSLSCDPLRIYRGNGSEAEETNTSLVASQTEDQEMTYTERGGGKDSRLLWVGICLAMLTLTVCIIVLWKMKGA